jgi:hypothetical protein
VVGPKHKQLRREQRLTLCLANRDEFFLDYRCLTHGMAGYMADGTRYCASSQLTAAESLTTGGTSAVFCSRLLPVSIMPWGDKVWAY